MKVTYFAEESFTQATKHCFVHRQTVEDNSELWMQWVPGKLPLLIFLVVMMLLKSTVKCNNDFVFIFFLQYKYWKMFRDSGAIISRGKKTKQTVSIQISEFNKQVNADAVELERGFEGLFLLSFFFSPKWQKVHLWIKLRFHCESCLSRVLPSGPWKPNSLLFLLLEQETAWSVVIQFPEKNVIRINRCLLYLKDLFF